MSRSRRIVVALFLLVAVALAVGAALAWESFQPTVIELTDPVEALALSRDGTSLACCGRDLRWIYTTNGGVRVATPARPPDARKWLNGSLVSGFAVAHMSVRAELVFSAKDDLIFGVGATCEVRAWSARDGLPVPLPPLMEGSGSVRPAFSPAGDLVATQNWSDGLLLWELPDGRLLRRVTIDWIPWPDCELGFSPSGALLFARRRASAADVTPTWVRVWRVSNGRPCLVDGTEGTFRTVLDPGEIYVADRDGHAVVADVATNRERYRLTAEGPLALSRDGERLAVAGREGVELRSAGDGALIRKLAVRESERCTALAFSADRTRLAAAFGRRVYVWRLRR